MPRDESTRKLGMFTDVSNEQMTTATGETGPLDVTCSELCGQSLETHTGRLERLEHLPVTARGHATAGNDVTAIHSVATDRSREFVLTDECLLQLVSQGARTGSGQNVRFGVELESDRS